jgi:Methyltransferase domain
MSLTLDSKYYQVIRAGSLREDVMIRARRNIYDDFMRVTRAGAADTVLDVGVSDVVNDSSNVLEREYPYLHNITACGLGEGHEFREAFPACAYRKISPREPLPFSDKSFAIATANAVLEHVGSRADQVAFVKELCRVARQVFISVPNRYFPIEHHTSLPLLHYVNRAFRLACDLSGKGEWSREENLILMSSRWLRKIAVSAGVMGEVGRTGLRLGPLSSNLFLAIRKPML